MAMNRGSIFWIFFLLTAMILGPIFLRPRAPEPRLGPQTEGLRRQLMSENLRDALRSRPPKTSH